MQWRKIRNRVLEAALILLAIISLNFFLVRFMPGDVVMHIIGEDEYLRMSSGHPEALEEIRAAYGLDRSLPEQYGTYLAKVLSLDFGNSFRTKAPVLRTVVRRAGWTLILALPATGLAALAGGFLGLKVGYGASARVDAGVSGGMMVLLGVPANCIAILCLLFFSFRMGWFPLGGLTSGGLHGFEKLWDILWHAALPVGVLTLAKIPADYMLMKSVAASLKNEAYLDVARSKGLSKAQVLRRHLLKNALPPYITSVCAQFGQILGGAMLIEVVFSWKGMGTLIYDSVNAKDYPMLQTGVLFIGACIIAFNLLADFINMWIDPRIREGLRHD